MLEDWEVYRLMLENLQSVIYLCKLDEFFTPLQLYGQMETLSGYSADEFISGRKKIVDLYHPDEKAMIFEAVQKAAAEKGAFHLMFRVQHREGRWLWVESIGKIVEDEIDRGQVYVSGFLLDVTERKRVEDEYQNLSEIVRHSPASVVVTDIEGGIKYVNPKFEELTGYSFAEVLGKKPSVLKSDVQSREYYAELWQTILSGQEWRGEFANKKKNGELYWESASISPVFDQAGEIVSFIAVKEDITERKLAEAALAEAKAALEEKVRELEQRHQEMTLFSQMQAALQNCSLEEETYQVLAQYAGQLFPAVGGALYQMSPAGEMNLIVDWSNAEERELADEIKKLRCEDCARMELMPGEKFRQCSHALENHPKYQLICIPMYLQGMIWGQFQLVMLPGKETSQIEKLASSVVQQLLLTVENLRLRESLRSQAIHDPLTGLYNRRYLEAALESEVSRAGRKGVTVALMMLDIDHFKKFNDSWGHEAGDIVLRQLGIFLQTNVRNEDIACRYGGEEFLIILPEIGQEKVAQRAEELRTGVHELCAGTEYPWQGRLSISLGVAIFPYDGQSAQAVLQAADQALYQAKRAGRDRVVMFGQM